MTYCFTLRLAHLALYFLLMIKMVLKHSAEETSRGLQGDKAVVCLLGKIGVLRKFCSGTSYSADGHEFGAYESTLYTQ